MSAMTVNRESPSGGSSALEGVSMICKTHKTTRKARIRWNGKTYTRRIYEFLDPDTKWWRDCVKLGSMSLYNGNSLCPLDSFDDVTVCEEGAYMPGRWA